MSTSSSSSCKLTTIVYPLQYERLHEWLLGLPYTRPHTVEQWTPQQHYFFEKYGAEVFWRLSYPMKLAIQQVAARN